MSFPEVDRYSPGALVPFSPRGSSYESDSTALNWAISSNGMIAWTQRIPLANFVYGRGRPPYIRCTAAGYQYPESMMQWVDGLPYIPDFAPTSKDSF